MRAVCNRVFFLFAALLVSQYALASEPSSDGFEKSIVMISIGQQDTDVNSPWGRSSISETQILGTLTDFGILVTASSVQNAKYLKMQKFADSVFYDLSIDFIDHDINLALLKAEDPKATIDLRPLSVGPDLKKGTDVLLLAGTVRLSLSPLTLTIDDVKSKSSPYSYFSYVHYQLRTQKSHLGNSEPLILGRQLVGISCHQSNKVVDGIPAGVIKQFLQGRKGGTYKGVPSLGIGIMSLESIPLRRHLEVDKFAGGVRVVGVRYNSPLQGVLKPNDVILAIDGTNVTSQGTYVHPLWGFQSFQGIYNKKYAGDEVKIDYVRQGKPLSAQVILNRFDSNENLIPISRHGKSEPYIIFAGLVIQELSIRFLKLWGKDWKTSAPSYLLYHWHLDRFPIERARRIIILNRVLSDDHNRGYEHLTSAIIESVNGHSIDSLSDVNRALAEPLKIDGTDIGKIKFTSGGGEILLHYGDLDKVNQRIAKRYGILDQSSFFKN